MLSVAALNSRCLLTATSEILTSSGHDAKGATHRKTRRRRCTIIITLQEGPPVAGSHCQGGLWGDCAGLLANAWGSDWGLKLAFPKAARFWNLSRRYGSF